MRDAARIQGYFIICLILIFFFACSSRRPLTISIDHKTPLASHPRPTLTAGAARVDITPPPGMPMAGYSIWSCTGWGVRNKLMARAIYLKPARGRPIALVQSDLLFGSRIVHHKVAELVAMETDIGAAGLLMAGSHTHSAPGNYFGSNFYNDFASNKKGFSKKYFQFLSRRIAGAVIEAYNNRRPAKIASGSTRIKGVTVNRSFRAYLKNKDIIDKDKMDKFTAVNPDLHLIRIDCLDDSGLYKPLAAFSNFSIHPNTNPRELGGLYSGDTVAYTERCFESEVKRLYNLTWQPVLAAANYTHGDNNPYYGAGVKENFKDLKRHGGLIASEAVRCFRGLDNRLTDDVDIRYTAKEIDLFKENTIAGIKIAKKPKFGCAAVGGARGRGKGSFLRYIPFYAPGLPRLIFNKGEQGHKRIFLWPLQYLVLPGKNFPRFVFLQVIRIHDTVLMTVPWEVTYQMGKRISGHAAVKGKEKGLKGVSRYIVVSCSNGALGYVTTPEEYSRQYFEGGFNLYGPNTGDFIKLHLGDMVETVAAGINNTGLPGKWLFKLKAAEFYPKALQPGGTRRIHETPVFQQRKYRTEAFWSFKWYDVPPYLIDFHRPLVGIEVSSHKKVWRPLNIDGNPVDDSGSNISIHFLKKVTKQNMGLYQCKWYNPPGKDGKFYRFVIQPREGQKIFYSPSFQ